MEISLKDALQTKKLKDQQTDRLIKEKKLYSRVISEALRLCFPLCITSKSDLLDSDISYLKSKFNSDNSQGFDQLQELATTRFYEQNECLADCLFKSKYAFSNLFIKEDVNSLLLSKMLPFEVQYSH